MRRSVCSVSANTYSRAPDRVTVSKKSHARSASAWERRKSAQVLDVRSGADGIPASSVGNSRQRDGAPEVCPWTAQAGAA
ncbi:hypothetical protein QFZ49_005907 [Streptomyces turgidiscabies]|uniref:Uncharacterized protein n=1 Tax=Streptomyces turgidiscabies TaxID=85558 RepID=A0ABU0RVB5_9ACTN|nr:hypothetical protein [Streptomyces turgidiscabies]